MKGIQADASNPLDANDHHMIVSLGQTLASVEADMRREAGQVPPFVENYVSSVKVAWQFLSKTIVAMRPPQAAPASIAMASDSGRKRLRASAPAAATAHEEEQEQQDDDDEGEDIDYSNVPAGSSSPTYQF